MIASYAISGFVRRTSPPCGVLRQFYDRGQTKTFCVWSATAFHHANRTVWHRPSRKSDAVAQAITQIGRYGTNHHANRTGWQKRGLPSQESDAMAQTITQIGRNGAMAPDLRDFRAPFVPRRRICEMEGRDSAIPSDLRDGKSRGGDPCLPGFAARLAPRHPPFLYWLIWTCGLSPYSWKSSM